MDLGSCLLVHLVLGGFVWWFPSYVLFVIVFGFRVLFRFVGWLVYRVWCWLDLVCVVV